MKKDFERIVNFSRPFDKRSDIPNKNYGIGAMNIWFNLKGALGAVHVRFQTPFYLPETVDEYRIGNKNKTLPTDIRDVQGRARGFDCVNVGYHSPKPMYDGQTKEDCNILDEGYCYCDGSFSKGEYDGVGEMLYRRGEEAVWEYLEEHYYAIFSKERTIKTDLKQMADNLKDLFPFF